MSHEITEIDRHEGTSQAWHGLTDVKPVILLSDCWLTKWDVKKTVLGILDASGKFIAGVFCQLVCTDNESIAIGQPVHCDTYSVLTNKGFLQIVKDTMEKIRNATVESVGSVCRRGRIFVSLRIPELPTFNAANREFKPYLNFLSSHDKSAPFVVMFSTICTVCNNTFNMNLQDVDGKSFRATIRHTKGMPEALADIPAMIDAFLATAQKFAEVMNALSLVPISTDDARAFFASFVYENEQDAGSEKELAEVSTRRLNIIDRLTELFLSGKGNSGKNHADLFSAITDYYSHENSGGENVYKQVASSEFGDGHARKSLAFVILQDDKRTAKLIAKGYKVLANVKKA